MKRLDEEGSQKIEKTVQGRRAVNLIDSIRWQEIQTLEELEEFKRMDIGKIISFAANHFALCIIYLLWKHPFDEIQD